MGTVSQTIHDIRDIMGMLLHRAPFLLVDKIIAHEKGKSLTGIKNVTYNEPFFPGHFPLVPTMPGVLILEALAQCCGMLVGLETGIRPESGTIFYFAGIDNARFKRIVVPGDQLQLYAELDKVKRHIYWFKARATVDGEMAAEAELICALKKPEPVNTTELVKEKAGAEAQ
jgi:3-hydroxyacyl-[acyl-carrier-protein] dehydratase